MAAQTTDEHIATFATESTWEGLADALIEKYDGIATRIVLYNALGDHERFERYGTIGRGISLYALPPTDIGLVSETELDALAMTTFPLPLAELRGAVWDATAVRKFAEN